MTHNGPAIWRAERLEQLRRSSEGARLPRWQLPDASTGMVLVLSREPNMVQARPTERLQSFGRGGYGTCFCNHGTEVRGLYVGWGREFQKRQIMSLGIVILLTALAQCRGTICPGATYLSRNRILIGCRCGSPGAADNTNLSWVKNAKQKPWQTTYP
jgi:hypothetical protein